MRSSRKVSRQDEERLTKGISTFQTLEKELSNWKWVAGEEDREGNCTPEANGREFQDRLKQLKKCQILNRDQGE